MAENPARGGPGLLLGITLVGGLGLASFRALNWPDKVRPRQLVVLAPEGAEVAIVDGTAPLDAREGVHTWSVNPGPITLTVTPESGSPQSTGITVPKGLGSLMLELRFDERGELLIGYF